MGVSEACYIPAGLALIADYHRGTTRSLANGLHMSGIYVGAALGGVNHQYQDGYVRVDSSGNAGGLTSNWGYQNGAQVVGDTLRVRLDWPGVGAGWLVLRPDDGTPSYLSTGRVALSFLEGEVGRPFAVLMRRVAAALRRALLRRQRCAQGFE